VAVEALPVLWPVAAATAVVCGGRWRAAKRRVELNRALHELRRPLQVIALAPEGPLRPGTGAVPGPMELALAALDDLDSAVNGTRPLSARRPVLARPLVSSALERWGGHAARSRRSLSLDWRAGPAVVMADPARIAQALDNLLANAIEHGGLRVRLEASVCPAGLRIAVVGPAGVPARRAPDPRRGHGLEVVRRIALAHGGRFQLRHDRAGSLAAVLELPLAPAALSRAA
jgi:signal transduction histidine kinase